MISPPPATEMFHFAGLPSIPYFLQVWMMRFRTSGFPIRRSWALSGAGPLPRLFAACHVLLRLQVPRHPPCARSIFSLTLYLGLLLACMRMGVFPHKGNATSGERSPYLLRKEVIQPQLPLQLPCYDLSPLTRHTFSRPLPVTSLLVPLIRVD